ncbi:hypothetical protein UNSWDHB_482 [Dehalobacter sp. UNSWDHB]|jgi:hypothetical protein|uniref:hypothetical protein n=1 Tax=unclassified Dehalobacter TaxID=2635733 RepID=UPI00028B51B1|nr:MULTISPECIES: hypothetical protein [unclassified Dehalobacter]AFV03332.1 hypothetical protein DHBDCA_p2305 [Dehalobacter sp. DCA]AFV06320.1 hypothetical protein DCF50_p2317 [Dehalobacter sp. CF]EQB22188.1 hypothetical protein UNSWDHB_482 [Dehalobacter sp. UNSWDHB]
MDTITLPQSFFTLQDLSSLGGTVIAVYVIVSFLKDYLKILGKRISKDGTGDWIVRPSSVLISFLIIIWTLVIRGEVSGENIGLAVINAFLVALIAGAAHDYIVAPTKEKAVLQAMDKENLKNNLENQGSSEANNISG